MAIFTAIAGYLTTTLVGLGLSTVVAGAVANIAIGAALLGIGQLASAAFAGSRPQTSTPQAQATINQSAGPRIRGYGRAKLGGTRAFWDSRNGVLHQIVMAHHGEIDEFEVFYVGDILVERDGGQVITPPLSGHVQIFEHYGANLQDADETLAAAWPGIWTDDHRLNGIAYWAVGFGSPTPESFQAIFPEGYNTPVRCICRLSKVWDPRDPDQSYANKSSWKWSDNAALCILDYLTHPDGFNRNIDDIDVPSFMAKADIDGEFVLLADGGMELRYRLWGIYALTDDPQDVLGKMRASSDAELYQTAEGKIAIRGGAWEAPTVTIRESDILAHSMEQGSNRFAAFNELKILYTSPFHDYQTTEATSWEDLEDQAERGVLTSSLNLDMVPSPSQARRLAKIHIAKSNPEWKGTIVANLSALNALGERTVRIVINELGIDDAFFVAGFSIRPDLTGVELSVMSISEASYAWTLAEEGETPPVPEDTRPDLSFPIPENLVLSQPVAGFVQVLVDLPNRDGLELHAQLRAGAGAVWRDMQNGAPNGAYIGPLSAGTYQVQARWRAPQGTAGEFSFPLVSITI